MLVLIQTIVWVLFPIHHRTSCLPGDSVYCFETRKFLTYWDDPVAETSFEPSQFIALALGLAGLVLVFRFDSRSGHSRNSVLDDLAKIGCYLTFTLSPFLHVPHLEPGFQIIYFSFGLAIFASYLARLLFKGSRDFYRAFTSVQFPWTSYHLVPGALLVIMFSFWQALASASHMMCTCS